MESVQKSVTNQYKNKEKSSESVQNENSVVKALAMGAAAKRATGLSAG